jgi:predicted lipoprotein with Yx(FWY)xxD motif
MRNRWLAASVLAAAAVVGLAACGGSSSSSVPTATKTSDPATSSASSDLAAGIKTTAIEGRTVLTDSAGFVLYWFAPDTPTTSKCNGSCATFWPPLIGTPSLGSGVTLTGQLGTIKRANGQLQATYDGHPLYLFKSDTTTSMWTGNDIVASGAKWWLMTSTGSKLKKKDTATAPSSGSGGSSSSPSSGSGSGGYGY